MFHREKIVRMCMTTSKKKQESTNLRTLHEITYSTNAGTVTLFTSPSRPATHTQYNSLQVKSHHTIVSVFACNALRWVRDMC